MPQLNVGFEIAQWRGYGGNLLSVIYPFVDWSAASIDTLIEREKQVLSRGEIPYYAIIVARPKHGPAKRLASLRYFVEPKLKRIGREIRARGPKPPGSSHVKPQGS